MVLEIELVQYVAYKGRCEIATHLTHDVPLSTGEADPEKPTFCSSSSLSRLAYDILRYGRAGLNTPAVIRWKLGGVRSNGHQSSLV